MPVVGSFLEFAVEKGAGGRFDLGGKKISMAESEARGFSGEKKLEVLNARKKRQDVRGVGGSLGKKQKKK